MTSRTPHGDECQCLSCTGWAWSKPPCAFENQPAPVESCHCVHCDMARKDPAPVKELVDEIDDWYAANDPLMAGAGDGNSPPWLHTKLVGRPTMDTSAQRKATPVFSGVLAYFPLALAAIARVSKAGNDKHNPGQPLHWSKDKSTDHSDCLVRHQLDVANDPGGVDPETGELHEASVAWRALAQLQIALERQREQSTR